MGTKLLIGDMMGQWTNPNVTQVTSLAMSGSLTGTPATTMAAGPSTYQPVVLQNVSSFASYDLNMYGYAQSAGAVGAALVIPITLQWFDDLVSGIPVFEEDWYIWAGRAAPVSATSYMAASGPMHGVYMTVTISNIATAGLVVQYFNLFGSNRVVPYSDWRQNGVTVNPESNGLTSFASNATADAFDNVLLGVDSALVGASAAVWIPLGLYAGPCYFRLDAATTPLHNIVLCTCEGMVSGALIPGTSSPGVLVNVAGTGGTEYELEFIAGRAPLALVVQGAATTGSVISARVIAQQAA
jgi:hypothetical protein